MAELRLERQYFQYFLKEQNDNNKFIATGKIAMLETAFLDRNKLSYQKKKIFFD